MLLLLVKACIKTAVHTYYINVAVLIVIMKISLMKLFIGIHLNAEVNA